MLCMYEFTYTVRYYGNMDLHVFTQPQQQPESTSADEHPDSSSKDVTTPTKKNQNQNTILKQLLSEEDEVRYNTMKDHCSVE